MAKYILFVCERNRGRSQMAQAFFNSLKKEFSYVGKEYEAISAGAEPGDRVNPVAIQAMLESGIDMSDTTAYFPKGVDSDYIKSRGSNVKRVIMVCDFKCGLPGEISETPEYWEVPETRGQSLDDVRKVRDLIGENVRALLKELSR